MSVLHVPTNAMRGNGQCLLEMARTSVAFVLVVHLLKTRQVKQNQYGLHKKIVFSRTFQNRIT